LHDAIIGERLGLPSVSILTDAFTSAGELMASALGAKGYEFVVTDHPIASASNQEISERAQRAVRESTTILLQS